ncbi:hypothetical protein [Geobacter sp. DSM 9736]|uniref:hypothetical protein n=1 Tax=Geobacter sp. DSM 9736 TaxID=1277350 RepID=UPI000B51263A|nr:hypothetical protein [Geobacter sp. DSM 9736]SNB44733.1 hypothetical protein SAMN06269301_0120 [Geobacter sp. DSM 9736]
MNEEVLVHESEIEIHGSRYTINVFCRMDGRHVARTRFGVDDVIINDGGSLQEVLEKHERLLPLAITSRQMFHKLSVRR